FAEVFRRRSFLFMGSGLQEDYLLNLFGEILINFGSGHLPHFCLMPYDKAKQYGDFLLRRLNTIAIPCSHEELPENLNKFFECAQASQSLQTRGTQPLMVFRLALSNEPTFTVNDSELPLPNQAQNEYTAVSLGKSARGYHEGSMAKSVLRA